MKKSLLVNRMMCALLPLSAFMSFAGAYATVSVPEVQESRPLKVRVSSGVKTEVVVDEDFSKWTAGSQDSPSPEMVTEAQAETLMDYTGQWVLFRMYEAGGAGYMGFDEVGDDGPGYIKSPGLNLRDEYTQYWRLSCRVKNVNNNAQDQGLQSFVFDESNSSIITASTQPMKYGEWSDCEWIGESKSDFTSFMLFGWKGNVLIDRFKVERLIFPLATPLVNGAELLPDCSAKVTWNKVEGADSYIVEMTDGFTTVKTEEVGDVDSCVIQYEREGDDDYTFYVTACAGDDVSYPGYYRAALVPDHVGRAVALPPTDITADGFTACWEPADYASDYLVFPVVTHTAAAAGEEFYYLNETFSNVPASADMYAPIQIAPMLGMDGTDLYMSRGGYTIDMGMFVRMSPDMPVLALTSQYADYGLEGALMSPETDYSVGDGKVRVQGLGVSALDDVVMLCGFIDEQGELYASETFEVDMEGAMFDVELSGGKAGSRFVLKIYESTEGGDMVIIPMLSLSTSLGEGETVTVPVETVHTPRVTEARLDMPVDKYNSYSYSVQGYYSAALMGEVSNSVSVGNMSKADFSALADGKVYLCGGILHIENPEGLLCVVYTSDGRCVASTSSTECELELPKGVYVVRIGDRTVKVVG